MMRRRRSWGTKYTGWIVLCASLGMLFAGCEANSPHTGKPLALAGQRVFALKEITPQQAAAFLTQLNLGTPSVPAGRNGIAVAGSAGDLYRAGILLDVVDTRDESVIKTLAPVSDARSIATNTQIAEALGGVSIGTFTNPPPAGERTRAIIDIHGSSVVAIIPARLQNELLAFVQHGPDGLRQVRGETKPRPPAKNTPAQTGLAIAPGRSDAGQEPNRPAEARIADASPARVTAAAQAEPASPAVREAKSIMETQGRPGPTVGNPAEEVCSVAGQTLSVPPSAEAPPRSPSDRRTVVPKPAGRKAPVTHAVYGPPRLPNGEDVLQLDLPERLEMMQLLDLAAEYLSLDYLCDLEKIKNQSVSLRLHGKLAGEIKVKDLYALLESVLKFKGFAMTCHRGGLVTVVPVTDALQVDPALIDANDASIEAGDTVVTRVFDLQYVNAASAMNLLESMKLSMAASPIEESGSLIVTCYAYRMARIERLLNMIDRPGRPKEFRFRQLKYTMANTLAKKVETIVAELQTVPVKIAPMEAKSSLPALTISNPPSPASAARKPVEAASTDSAEKSVVYLDADDRTNRILMIGQAEQLVIVEEVIDALDVAQHDPRALRVYPVVHLGAADAKKKLEDLEVLGQAKKSEGGAPPVFISKTSSSDKASGTGTVAAEMSQMQVTVLEATNSLLVNATDEQHARIATVLRQVDVVQQDLRTLKVYDIKHVNAEDVKKQLAEFGLIGKSGKGTEKPAPATAAAASGSPAADGTGSGETATMQEPQVSVVESTNSLLVNATDFQHTRIASVISHVDTTAREESIPYEIYFLENQDPEQLAEVVQRIFQETVKDKDGKIEKVIPKVEEQIVIVPDKNTFSLIVYASMKNQQRISKLIKTLDKRQPQVLIDATLVEIRKSDEFNYDLEFVASIPDLTQTSGQTQQFMADENTTVVDKLLQSDRTQFADFQVKSGKGIGFYGDKHINALLTAVQTKNYGRILAKPKVLVNDNEKGTIKTADTTYVVAKSSIPVVAGAAGTQNQLIETAVRYESYEAGITLEITPHISEGDLLRLEVMLTRSDFTSTANEKPPNLTSSDVGTVVTVPDGSTIILGGMLKLNQNKGGSKVPILGDLPLVGGVFRSIDNSDLQSMLYIFVRAEVIRPADLATNGYDDLKTISEENRRAFEGHEREFQKYESWPGVPSQPIPPVKVLDAR